MMVERANMPGLLAGLHTLELIISQNSDASTLYTIVHKLLPASVQAELYRIMECQFHMLPPYDATASPFDYQEPDHPALTKSGWIKSEVVGILMEGSEFCTSFLWFLYIHRRALI